MKPTELRQESELRMPAEWERQRAIMLTWPDSDTDWKPYLDEVEATYISLVSAIVKHEELVIAAREPSQVMEKLSRTIADELLLSRIHAYRVDINDTWARDHGPISLLRSNGEILLKDFRFNGWGEKFAWQKDNAITSELYLQGAFAGSTIESEDSMVLEGGSIETDGAGLLFTTRQCLLAPRRNQPMEEPEITIELRRRLAVEHVAWIDGLQLAGDDTDGHIDTIVRLAPDQTVLYVDDSQIAGLSDDYHPLKEQIEEALTPYYDRLRLIKLPMPRPVFDEEGLQLPATYANYVVINGAVIVPSYRQADADRLAANLIGQAFPGREVVSIDATPIIQQHGSLHCITMQLY